MHFECVFVALGIQLAMRMCHTAICVLSGYTLFFHTISNDTIKKIVIVHKMCVLVFCTTFVCNISHSRKK